MTSAAVALGEERSVVREPATLEVEIAERSGFSAGIALGTIALVQVGWLATLGYFAFAIVR